MQTPQRAKGHFNIRKLADTPTDSHAAARTFCLQSIKEIYGIDYTPGWHVDLDSLLLQAGESWYSSANGGAFWICENTEGEITATCGLYAMKWKPETLARVAGSFVDERTCQVSRMYVREDIRRHGIGSKLEYTASCAAAKLGYQSIYLHADAGTQSALNFWKSRGYRELGLDQEFSIVEFKKEAPR